ALNLFEKIRKSQTPSPKTQSRFRIEHAQIVSKSDIHRFKELNVTTVIQPQFFASDRHWAVERLGPERMKNAYRWKSLLDTGAHLLGSSDSPVEEPNPFRAIELLQK